MKRTKIVAIIITVLMMCSMLAACGSNSSDPIVGTWEMSGAKASGQEITIDQYLTAAGTKDIPTFVFDGDNTMEAKDFAGVSGSGKWSVKDGKYTMDFSGVKYESTIKDETISIEAGGAILIFTKK